MGAQSCCGFGYHALPSAMVELQRDLTRGGPIELPLAGGRTSIDIGFTDVPLVVAILEN